jgi:tetratricopeptide (TPR) repeat protein
VVTKDAQPHFWAKTQSNLGNSYLLQSEQSGREEAHKLLEKAVEAYMHVLEVVTKEAQPDFWAETQNNLGNSFLVLANWMEQAGRGFEEILNLGLARKAFESASDIDPDSQRSVQIVDLKISRVTSSWLKEQ